MTRILGPELEVVDARAFYYNFDEIFRQHIYGFHSERQAPRIIDGGANIGLSVIYFKRQFPPASIVAFEPDAEIFKTLKRNLAAFGLQDVTLVNAAIWNEQTTIDYYCEGADAGRIVRPLPSARREPVATHRLHDWLREPVDLLKLDIEGAEVDVLVDIEKCLDRVENIFVEYHSFEAETQRLDELLRVLRRAGFRVQIHTQFASKQPLVQRQSRSGMDLQLNVFAYRP